MSEKDYPTEGQLTNAFPVFTEASRLHRARAMEQNHINNFMAMRAKANRLVAGNPKAARIVREIDATLEKLQLSADGIFVYVEEQGAKEAFLKLEVDQGQKAYPAEKKQLINKDLEVQERHSLTVPFFGSSSPEFCAIPCERSEAGLVLV